MKKLGTALLFVLVGVATQLPAAALAATCANGVYAAGCVGPNGAIGVKKQPYYRPPVYHPPSAVRCASGVYRAGCVGPNGAVVVKKAY